MHGRRVSREADLCDSRGLVTQDRESQARTQAVPCAELDRYCRFVDGSGHTPAMLPSCLPPPPSLSCRWWVDVSSTPLRSRSPRLAPRLPPGPRQPPEGHRLLPSSPTPSTGGPSPRVDLRLRFPPCFTSPWGRALVDDEAQLEADLAFTPRKTFSGCTVRGPPGATAITSFGIVYTGVLWVLTLAALGRVASTPSSDRVPLGAVASLLVLGGELFVAQWLAAKTWRAIGPTARTVLRPLMLFGPWPVVVMVGFLALFVMSAARGAATAELFHRPPVVGLNWKRFDLAGAERGGVTYDKAMVRCPELGDGWRLPTQNDLATLRPAFEGQGEQFFWLSGGDGPWLMRRNCRPRPCSLEHSRPGGAEFLAQVICFKP
jgi:hypothetical protein